MEAENLQPIMQYDIAFPALALSSLTDWLDGYVARMQNIRSILGSYLDPLADKVLVGSVVGAMGYTVCTVFSDLQIQSIGHIKNRDIVAGSNTSSPCWSHFGKRCIPRRRRLCCSCPCIELEMARSQTIFQHR